MVVVVVVAVVPVADLSCQVVRELGRLVLRPKHGALRVVVIIMVVVVVLVVPPRARPGGEWGRWMMSVY